MNQQVIEFRLFIKVSRPGMLTESVKVLQFIKQHQQYFTEMGYKFDIVRIIIDKVVYNKLSRLGVKSLPCLYKLRRSKPPIIIEGYNRIAGFLLKDINDYKKHLMKNKNRLESFTEENYHDMVLSSLNENDNETSDDMYKIDQSKLNRKMSQMQDMYKTRRPGRRSSSYSKSTSNNVGTDMGNMMDAKLTDLENSEINNKSFSETGDYTDFTEKDLWEYQAEMAKMNDF